MSVIDELMGVSGPLARHIPGFAPRAAQLAMAGLIHESLSRQGQLAIEAGTGTGKTFAYLVPALLSGLKIIISTGTRHLQDQLYHRDLPLVRAALEVPARTALLKGRANYLCWHRLETIAGEGKFKTRETASDLESIRTWAGRTDSGDISELPGIAEDSRLWPGVTSTTDNCLGQECEHFSRCFVVRARRAAQEADLVVVNHHLFFADLALKEEGFGDLLPGAQACILDEAHQLPDAASLFFGKSLGSRQFFELGRDVMVEHLREAGDMQDLPDSARRLEQQVQALRLTLGKTDRRAPWSEVAGEARVTDSLDRLREGLEALGDWLKLAAPRGQGLENCWRRCESLRERMDMLTSTSDELHIRWFETRQRSFRMNMTPLDVAPIFHAHLESLPRAWIFTSATLAVGDDFRHFTRRMGLVDAETRQLHSPFDYSRNALLYLPPDMPDPNEARYTGAVIAHAREILAVSQGRAFLLFTSHRALQQAARMLEDDIEYPLLVQGSAPRRELLNQFRQLGNAVLLGTSSFWEGVDVRGPALSCVIIDKLPFASPGDPVLQARIETLRRQGGNPFMEYQLPAAVIALKQGIGRLIRDVEDRGVLVICDPRLEGKSYGRLFLDSLPEMPHSRSIADIESFFKQDKT